ncbi:MAG: ABC transporter ATP-binding protein, partial [Bacteroidales bacterium]|nr:ABC transporter ATP-binding protein [Bacteroidales bacterium]
YPHTSWTGALSDYDYSRVEYAIESTGLRNLSDRYVEELSDGERQRAMIGRVVAQDTPLIILDEPTAFLDIKSRYEITDLLRRLAEENGRTVIFSTHDLQAVFGICGRMLLLTEKEVAEGAPEDLALNGTLNLLFDDPVLKFNPEDATVSFLRQMTGTVQVTGAQGIVRLWTCRTVQRTGFNPVSTEAPLRIEIRDGVSGRKWICSNKEYSQEVTLENLYDTGRWLVEQKKHHDPASQRLNFL